MPGCSTSAAGDEAWGWSSGWVATQASRGGSGGWKVGEVSCGCFLFTVLALRGAGSGCLLTVLGKGGEGREFRRANHTPSDRVKETERDRKTARAETDRWCERQDETPLPEFSETSEERRTPKDIKPHDSDLFKENNFELQHGCRGQRRQMLHHTNKEEAHTKHKTSNLQCNVGFNWEKKAITQKYTRVTQEN